MCVVDREHSRGRAQSAGPDLDGHCRRSVCCNSRAGWELSLTVLLDLWGALLILVLHRGSKHISESFGERMARLFEFFPGESFSFNARPILSLSRYNVSYHVFWTIICRLSQWSFHRQSCSCFHCSELRFLECLCQKHRFLHANPSCTDLQWTIRLTNATAVNIEHKSLMPPLILPTFTNVV